jgi:uncharacterized protein (TIGR03067 family)
VSLAFAPVPFPRPVRGELKQLQGTWVQVSAQNDPGERLAKNFNQPAPLLIWIITADYLTDLQGLKKSRNSWARISPDVRAKPRRLIIWLPPSIFGECRVQAIYRLEGDVLTVCYDTEGDSLPSVFPGPDDKRFCCRIFNRKKR